MENVVIAKRSDHIFAFLFNHRFAFFFLREVVQELGAKVIRKVCFEVKKKKSKLVKK